MTTLPAVVTIVDLPSVSTVTGSLLFEAVETVAGQVTSVQISLSQMNNTSVGGLPTGGSTANVLTKTSATNFAAEWGQVNLATSAAVTGILPVPYGGSGTTSLTEFGVLVGQGTTAFTAAAPATSGLPLVSGGTAAIPVYNYLDLAGITSQVGLSVLGVSGTATAQLAPIVGATAGDLLQVNSGGTGVIFSGFNTASLPGPFQIASFTAFGVVYGNGSSALGATAPGTTGWPIVGQGTSAAPVFTTLGVIGGGTGQTTLLSFGVLIGQGTSGIAVATAGAATTLLVSTGTAALAAFTSASAAGIVIQAGNQALSGGYSQTTIATGTISSGTFTVSPLSSNMLSYLNAGAHTIAPPQVDCTMLVMMRNTTGAGAVTTATFTKRIGDTIGTAVGSTYFFYISRSGSTSLLNCQAFT